MGYVILALTGFAIGCLLFAVVNALRIKADPPAPCNTKIAQSEMDIAAEKLGAMVRIPCVSKAEDEDLTEFFNYHQVLEAHFPLLHKILEKDVLNGTLLYRWAGKDSTKKPIMLMGHQDVVPASDEGWQVPAYSGAVIDGDLYGRGALDCKSTMYVELQAVEELLAEGFIPPCDVYLAYSINEETGGDGAAAVVRHLKKRVLPLPSFWTRAVRSSSSPWWAWTVPTRCLASQKRVTWM